eukprot:TRINITY_DN8900_c0_g1_i1.p1 TRINITY_DN8900_c0_g1~~TRINITY_DN8900_c0_g1_i1.p1  ORF type:complete len:278 (-),score=94.91 TRINITY_DN8900_c0_g1_i1:60-893(-)
MHPVPDVDPNLQQPHESPPRKRKRNEKKQPLQQQQLQPQQQQQQQQTSLALVPMSNSSTALVVKEDDANKGLRHFSLKVCQKVEGKRSTSYNEVADELVAEIATSSGDKIMTAVEQKNVRRRVYDVLNVLMAMNIIAKDKKAIQWIGLPTNAKRQLEELQAERTARIERIAKKEETMKELHTQRASYRNLLARNNSLSQQNTPIVGSRIPLPFIVVNTRAQTVINCEVAQDRSKYFFNFSQPFEIHDDVEILKRMGLAVDTGVPVSRGGSGGLHATQ